MHVSQGGARQPVYPVAVPPLGVRPRALPLVPGTAEPVPVATPGARFGGPRSSIRFAGPALSAAGQVAGGPAFGVGADLVLQARAEQIVGVGCGAVGGNGLLAHVLAPDCKETALSVAKTGGSGTQEMRRSGYASCVGWVDQGRLTRFART